MAKVAWKGALDLTRRNLRKIRLDDIRAFAKHFSEASFQDKIKSVVSLLGENLLIPVLEAYYVLRAPETSTKKKLLIMGALGYFILPTDFIPDFIPGILGFTDDLMVISIVLKNMNDAMTPAIKEKARRLYTKLTTCPLDKPINNDSL